MNLMAELKFELFYYGVVDQYLNPYISRYSKEILYSTNGLIEYE